MKRLNLIIAGTSVSVQLDGALAALRSQLRKIFRGFVAPEGPADARIIVSYDHRTFGNRLDAHPHLLAHSRERTPFLLRVAELYPFESPLLIGFLNGVLAYKPGAQEARLHLFRSEGENVLVGSLIRLLFLFVALLMVERDKLMIHAAGLKMGGEGALFLGVSGAGKSTVAAHVDREGVLSDDAPVVARRGASFTIHASPFSQVDLFGKKAADHHRKEAPLTRLVFLHQADRLVLEQRERRLILAELTRGHIHGFDVMDRGLRVKAFQFCCDLCAAVPGFDLHFQNSDRFLTLFPP